MIFLTVGAERFPFDRLIKYVDEISLINNIGGRVFGQIGTSKYLPSNFEYKRFLSFKEMLDRLKESKIIISHAGVGSTILSFSLKKIPILVPRQHELGEHIDNHQIEFALKMSLLKKCITAYNRDELFDKITNYDQIVNALKPDPSSSSTQLSKELLDIVSHKRRN